MRRLVLVLAVGLLAGCVRQPDAPKPAVATSSAQSVVLPEVKTPDLRLGAEAGDSKAQYTLGKMLLDKGSYFDPSPEGVSWLEKAAAQGSLEARLALGYRYRAAYCSGPVERMDKCHQARRWFQEAAESGDQEAMGVLITMLSHPPLKDPQEAYYWSLMRQRQKAMPPNAWIEESTTLKATLPNEQAAATEQRAKP
jgi:hypothetical protein